MNQAAIKAKVYIRLGKYYIEKLEFLVLNFLHNQKVIPSVVEYKDFEFEKFIGRLKWPTLANLESPEDAEITKKLALKFYQRAITLYQTAQE